MKRTDFLFSSNGRPEKLRPGILFYFILSLIFIHCGRATDLPAGDAHNGGLFLPGNFEAVIVADSLGRARHMAVNDNGDIYVKLRGVTAKGGNVGLRDTDKDGKADIVTYFGEEEDTGEYGTAMRIYKGYLYYSVSGAVYRTKLTPGKLIPENKTETVLIDDYRNSKYKYEHIAKPLAFDDKGRLYVPFGSPSDVCQLDNRVPGAPGQIPCPQLEEHAGIWQFDADVLNQTQKNGKRYATGIRSAVAMAWNFDNNALYVVQHGRDDLARTWPQFYSPWQSSMLPSEEFLQVKEGADGGWPYYYYDQMLGKKLLNPEYGGDGKKQGDGDKCEQPLIGFPGHWAPNDLFFYTGNQFPERYKNGAFIAFHGSTIRAPYPQGGYFVCFVPFRDGKPFGPWEVFADGFAGTDPIVNTSDAAHRPMGIAMGPDGSLYISESVKGKIWRIMYKGTRDHFGSAQLEEMERRKNRSNLRTPDEIKDNLQKGTLSAGASLYERYCRACHQQDGSGDGARFPPLNGSEWVNGNKERLIKVMLNGLSGPITVKGVAYNGIMPAHNFLKDEEIAILLNYIRQNFNKIDTPVTPEEVKKLREKNDAARRRRPCF